MNADSLPTVLELPDIKRHHRVNVYCVLQQTIALLDKAEFSSPKDVAELRVVRNNLETLLYNVK
jgi:hypothetical protein